MAGLKAGETPGQHTIISPGHDQSGEWSATHRVG
jgi:hypothetical protein